MCVCTHTHIEPRARGKVKARVHAFGWEIEKAAKSKPLHRRTEAQTESVCNAAFRICHFRFSPSTVLKVAALKGNNHYLLSKGIDPGSALLLQQPSSTSTITLAVFLIFIPGLFLVQILIQIFLFKC